MHARLIRSVVATATLVASIPSPADFSVERVVGELNQPICLTQAPDQNNSLYIVERAASGNEPGRILRYDHQAGTNLIFLDLSGSIQSDCGEFVSGVPS